MKTLLSTRATLAIFCGGLGGTERHEIVVGIDSRPEGLRRDAEAFLEKLLQPGLPVHLMERVIHGLGLAGKAVGFDDPLEQFLINMHGHLHAILDMALAANCQTFFPHDRRPPSIGLARPVAQC